jgi:hypothetical protein
MRREVSRDREARDAPERGFARPAKLDERDVAARHQFVQGGVTDAEEPCGFLGRDDALGDELF